MATTDPTAATARRTHRKAAGMNLLLAARVALGAPVMAARALLRDRHTPLDDTPHALGLGYLIGCSVITAIAWTLVQKHGKLAAR